VWLICVALAILGGCKPAGGPVVFPAKPAAPAPIPSTSPAQTAKVPSADEPSVTTIQPAVEPPPPLAEVPAAVRENLESLGARIIQKANGYSIDIRRKSGFTDDAIDAVIECPQVVDLTLEKVSITDAGLAKLRGLPELSRLILNDCPISGSGLQTLSELPLREKMYSIGLRGTMLKDGDLTWLKECPRLQRVDVSQTALTDASLADLEMLPLTYLNVAQTSMSAAGLDQFQQKKPQLTLKR
jgi:hypothetical protein